VIAKGLQRTKPAASDGPRLADGLMSSKSETLMHVGVVAKREGADCLRSLVVDDAEQVRLIAVIDGRTEMRGVQVVLDEAVLRAPFVKSPPRHLPAIGQRFAITPSSSPLRRTTQAASPDAFCHGVERSSISSREVATHPAHGPAAEASSQSDIA